MSSLIKIKKMQLPSRHKDPKLHKELAYNYMHLVKLCVPACRQAGLCPCDK